MTDEPSPPIDPAADSASSDEAAAFGLLEELGELEGLPSLLRVTHPAPSAALARPRVPASPEALADPLPKAVAVAAAAAAGAEESDEEEEAEEEAALTLLDSLPSIAAVPAIEQLPLQAAPAGRGATAVIADELVPQTSLSPPPRPIGAIGAAEAEAEAEALLVDLDTQTAAADGEGGDFSAVALEAALQAEETKAEEGAAVEEEAAGLSELETELAAAQRELPPTPPAADELGLVETEVADAMSQLDVGGEAVLAGLGERLAEQQEQEDLPTAAALGGAGLALPDEGEALAEEAEAEGLAVESELAELEELLLHTASNPAAAAQPAAQDALRLQEAGEGEEAGEADLSSLEELLLLAEAGVPRLPLAEEAPTLDESGAAELAELQALQATAAGDELAELELLLGQAEPVAAWASASVGQAVAAAATAGEAAVGEEAVGEEAEEEGDLVAALSRLLPPRGEGEEAEDAEEATMVNAYAVPSLPTLLADFGAVAPEWASAAVRRAAPLDPAAAPPDSVGGAEVAEAGVAEDVVAALAQLLRDGDEYAADGGTGGVAVVDLGSIDAAEALAVELDDDSLPQELIDILQGSGEEGQVLVDVSGVLSMQRVGSAALLAVGEDMDLPAAPEEWVLPFTEEDAAVFDVSAEEADALAVDMDEMVDPLELSSAARVASLMVPQYMLVNELSGFHELTEELLGEEGGDLDELVAPLLRDPLDVGLVSSLPRAAHGTAPPLLIEPQVDDDELDRLGLAFLRDGEGIAALFPGLAAGDGTLPLMLDVPLAPPPLPLASRSAQLPPTLASPPPRVPPPLHAPATAPGHAAPADGRAAAPPLPAPPPQLTTAAARTVAPPAAAPPHVPPTALPAKLTTLAAPLRRGLQHASLASLGSVLCVPLTLGLDDPLGFLFDGTEALGLGLEELPAVATLDAVSLGGLSMGFGSASSVAGLPFGPTFDHLFEVALDEATGAAEDSWGRLAGGTPTLSTGNLFGSMTGSLSSLPFGPTLAYEPLLDGLETLALGELGLGVATSLLSLPALGSMTSAAMAAGQPFDLLGLEPLEGLGGLRDIDLLTDAWMPAALPGLSLATGASLGLSTASLPPTLGGLDLALQPFLDADLTGAEILLDHAPIVMSTVRPSPPPNPIFPLFALRHSASLPRKKGPCALTASSDPLADESCRRLLHLAHPRVRVRRRECPFQWRRRPGNFRVAGRPRQSFGRLAGECWHAVCRRGFSWVSWIGRVGACRSPQGCVARLRSLLGATPHAPTHRTPVDACAVVLAAAHGAAVGGDGHARAD